MPKKQFTYYLALLFFILLITPLSLWGQRSSERYLSQYLIDTWGKQDGLPSNTLSSIFQSSDGYLWISSYNGLIRFDGMNFSIFNEDHNEAIKVNSMADISEDLTNGKLWIGTNGGGVICYHKGAFERYGEAEGYPEYPIQSVYVDSKQRVWVGTRNKGLFVFEGQRFRRAFEQLELIAEVSINKVRPYKNNDKQFLVATEGKGLMLIDEHKGIIKIWNTDNGLPDPKIRDFEYDSKGNLWIATMGGAAVLDKNYNLRIISKLSNYAVNSIQVDGEDFVWFATTNGLLRRNPNNKQYETLATKDGVFGGNIQTIIIDRESSVWLPTYRMGLLRMRAGKFINYTENNGIATPSVSSIAEWSEDTILVGSDVGIIHRIYQGQVDNFPIKMEMPQDRVRNMLRDSQGRLWVCTDFGLLQRNPDGKEYWYDNTNILKDNQVRAVFEFAGRIWITTRSFGIFNIDPESQKVVYYDKTTGLSSNFVMCIEEDEMGNLWIGYNDAGIDVIRPEDGTVIKNYNTNSGLPSDLIFRIFIDEQGHRFVMHNKGFAVITKENQIFDFGKAQGLPPYSLFDVLKDATDNMWFTSSIGVIVVAAASIESVIKKDSNRVSYELFNNQDGMYQEECTGATFSLKDSKGRLWFTTLGGAAMIDPRSIPINMNVPPVHIERIRLDTMALHPKSIATDVPFEVEATVQRVVFDFTALSLLSSETIEFAYMLENFDKEFIYTSQERRAIYTNLPPGKYTFRVKAANSDGVWNSEGVSFTFVKKPYYYQTAWFYVLIILIFLLIVFGFYKWRLRQINIKNKNLERLVAERTAEINNQKEEIAAQKNQIEEQSEALKGSYEQIKIVSEIGKQINTSLELDTLINILYSNIQSLMPAEGFGIGIYNADENRIEYRNYIEKGEVLPYHVESVGNQKYFSEISLTGKRTILINDLETEYKSYVEKMNIKASEVPSSLIYKPLYFEDNPIGLLTVQSFDKNAYKNYHITILDALGTYVSTALANAQSYEVIKQKNKNITDSIRYGYTIQQAVLPTPEELRKVVAQYFVLYQPKDIVSGDFYWCSKVGNKRFVAEVDCTGHGVPGAFMSMIGTAFLTEIINLKRIYEPHKILEHLHMEVREALSQENTKNDDGMDATICMIEMPEDENEQDIKVIFAGAKQSLLVIDKEKKPYRIKGDRKSIGGRQKEIYRSFSQQEVILPRGSLIYLYSDGIIDQANENGLKVGSSRLQEWLLDMVDDDMEQQKIKLQEKLKEWKGQNVQRDDITFIGIRL
ncbi:MAG: SpoIIE family protein phosphatase [Bernardetiaceae bacterium]|nr:SpoIIE family protein phosphatase [Bernardetiaceae bacterium]